MTEIIEKPYYIVVTEPDGQEHVHGRYKTMQECGDEFKRVFFEASDNVIVTSYFETTRRQKSKGDVDHLIECRVKKGDEEE